MYVSLSALVGLPCWLHCLQVYYRPAILGRQLLCIPSLEIDFTMKEFSNYGGISLDDGCLMF